MSNPATGNAIARVLVAAPRLPASLIAMRPRQWTKNVLLFAGLLFASKLADPIRWIEAVAAFIAFCAVSSGAYLLNDVRDAPADRLHPTKRLRPVARGDLSARRAVGLSAVLTLGGIAIAAAIGASFVGFVCGFVGLQVAYTFWLKRVPFVDLLVIAGGFVIRAAAGARAIDVRISPWLLGCTLLLALFLGLAKRRGELALANAGQTPGRASLGKYTPRLLDRLLWITVVTTVMAYVLYTLTDTKEMVVTIPFVVFGIARYIYLIYRADAGEEPERVLLGDVPILICTALWAVAAILVLSTL